jgi:hypothetical protein
MRNLFTRLSAYARQSAAAFLVGLGIGSFLIGPAALALVFPGQFAPRQFPTQQTHYMRHVITITATQFTVDTNIPCVFAASTCSVRIGAFPYNAFVLRGNWFQGAVCNAATTCTMSLGTASAATTLVNAQDIKTVATGAPALTLVAAGAGAQLTGNGIAQTGADGGFDLFVTITFTGAAPSTGTIVFDLEYLGVDGGCVTNVALGATALTC